MFEQFVEETNTSTSNKTEEVENEADDKSLKKRNRNIGLFESEFCDIYDQAIRKLLDLDDGSNILYLRRFFRIFYPETTRWCQLTKSARKNEDFRLLLTCSLYYRLAYIYRIGVVLSSATAFHFQNVLTENPSFSKMLLKKRNVKICSLGSLCPSGVIGVAKVLEKIAKIMRIELEIFVTIVDAAGGWKNTSITALTGLEQFHRSTWKINFIQADVSKEVSVKVVKAIGESDIVTMINVNPKNMIGTVLKRITGAIRTGSLMFILDSSTRAFVKSCGGQTGTISDFHLIYEELCEIYTLQASSIEKLFVLYHKYFPDFGCDRKLDIFARAWVRRPSDENSTGHHPKSINRENRNSLSTINCHFNKWEVRFTKEMAKNGWNRKGTNKVISSSKGNRNKLMKQHYESKKFVNINREKLELKFDQDTGECSQSESEEDDWDDHYESKRQLARVQIGLSNISIFNLKCSLKRNTLGPALKGKSVKKKPIIKMPSIAPNDKFIQENEK